ncbi:hypothetical protein [Brevibacillus parabrevis]|uniref:hypothetical protein n=1 Tax=Brevibacillus parabrevis TaxID=54914 RepID=UPI0028D79DD2|nr:hypothetical protein [Brevibacillus parabrevis]MED1724341.1 hypothetical protein [Brevibacillus parabrevis]
MVHLEPSSLLEMYFGAKGRKPDDKCSKSPQSREQFFSQTVTDFWATQFLNGNVLYNHEGFTVTINPSLDEDRRVMVLETADGRIHGGVDTCDG